MAEPLLPGSPEIQLVDGSASVECPERIQQRADFESACVRFATHTDEGLRIFNAYRDRLSEAGWIFSYQARDGLLSLRWLNADCIERLFVIVADETVAFTRPRRAACGNERYNGLNEEDHAPLAQLGVSDRILLPDGPNIHLVDGSMVIECPASFGSSQQIEFVCLQAVDGTDGDAIFRAYFGQLSGDRWVFNNVVPPVYLFSRWMNASCVERVFLGGSEELAPRAFFFAHFRQPVCGERRYGGDNR